MIDLLTRPWPWYVAGPLIGLMVPALLLIGGKTFGVSATLRSICAAAVPRSVEFFRFDWRRNGAWSLALGLGMIVGGFIAGALLPNPDPIAISAATQADLAALGITDFSGLVPRELFTWQAAISLQGFILIVVGGFLVGFGSAYAGGCTSGHGVFGLADFQLPSLIALIGFFAGGLIGTFALLPFIL